MITFHYISLHIITFPSTLHLQIAIPLAKAGVHLFIEKPISSSTSDVNYLIEICKKNCCKLMVGYNLRFLPSLIKFREEILNQKIGKIFFVNAEVGQHIKYWRPEENYLNSISVKKKLGGGVLLGRT